VRLTEYGATTLITLRTAVPKSKMDMFMGEAGLKAGHDFGLRYTVSGGNAEFEWPSLTDTALPGQDNAKKVRGGKRQQTCEEMPVRKLTDANIANGIELNMTKFMQKSITNSASCVPIAKEAIRQGEKWVGDLYWTTEEVKAVAMAVENKFGVLPMSSYRAKEGKRTWHSYLLLTLYRARKSPLMYGVSGTLLGAALAEEPVCDVDDLEREADALDSESGQKLSDEAMDEMNKDADAAKSCSSKPAEARAIAPRPSNSSQSLPTRTGGKRGRHAQNEAGNGGGVAAA